MSNYLFDALLQHVGHDVEIVTYGLEEPCNVSLECVTCGCVICDSDVYDLTPTDDVK